MPAFKNNYVLGMVEFGIMAVLSNLVRNQDKCCFC